MPLHHCNTYEIAENGEPNYDKPSNYNDEKIRHTETFLRLYNYGSAITYCKETEEGILYVSNNEYTSQVNFCPFCGYEAKRKIQ